MSSPLFGLRHKVRIDPSTAPANGLQYIGLAEPNSDEDENNWAIFTITYASSEVSEINWAGGDAKFDKAWDDRLTYTYS